MNRINKPRALIADSVGIITRAAEKFIAKGWDVDVAESAMELFELIDKSKNSPYALVISGHRVSGTDGPDILEKVAAVSPMTQRMLILPSEETGLLMQAINRAGIHACMTSPFLPEELVSRAEICCRDFLDTVKNTRFRRLIELQNRQLYETAQELKKKERGNHDLLAKKKSLLLNLQIRRRQCASSQITLARLVDRLLVQKDRQAFSDLFEIITENLQKLFANAASSSSVQWEATVSRSASGQGINECKSPEVALRTKQCVYAVTLLREMAAHGRRKDAYINEKGEPEDYFAIEISDDLTTAWLKKKQSFDVKTVGYQVVLELLMHAGITYGVVADETINQWLFATGPGHETLLVARGEKPDPGKNGTIEYFFNIDYIRPGRIQEDGSIDFRDRGERPFVREGEVLAIKQPSRKGKPGIAVTGESLPAEEVADPPLKAGSGSTLSADGLTIAACVQGEPHVDAMGMVTVNKELEIQGDVDFRTGNINFNGNIVVSGTVRSGFSVKGTSLTANAIEEALIDLTGDLNVSNGITGATIRTVGNIQAKFINRCHIMGFGDFIVQKEIVDSTLLLSGTCTVQLGHVISSAVSARNGVNARNIGTVVSSSPVLRIGVDDHIQALQAVIDEEIGQTKEKLGDLNHKISNLRSQSSDLHRAISEKAQIQDRSQLALSDYRKQLEILDGNPDKASVLELEQAVKKLEQLAGQAKDEIETLFSNQDDIGVEIDALLEQVGKLEEMNAVKTDRKKCLKEFLLKSGSLPQLTVNGKILAGTTVTGPNTAITLHHSRSRCVIREVEHKEGEMPYFRIDFVDL